MPTSMIHFLNTAAWNYATEVTGTLTETAMDAVSGYHGFSKYIRRFGFWSKAIGESEITSTVYVASGTGIRTFGPIELRPLHTDICLAAPHTYAVTMAWYTRTIDTVDGNAPEETETDRLWRQIDPVIHHKVNQRLTDRAERPC